MKEKMNSKKNEKNSAPPIIKSFKNKPEKEKFNVEKKLEEYVE